MSNQYLPASIRIMQMLQEHSGYESSLMSAMRDYVDEYESERYYRYHGSVQLKNVTDGFRDEFTEKFRSDIHSSSGYVAIDHAIGGFRRGWLYMITGDVASGKSTLLYNLALGMSTYQPRGVMVYSLRRDAVGVARSMFTSITERHRHETGSIDPEENFKIEGTFYHPHAENYRVHISADNPMNLNALCNDIVDHHRDREVNYFLIDDPEQIYSDSPLHLLTYRRRIMYEKFKEICRIYKICIIMARRSEINDVERQAVYHPGLHDLESRGYCLKNIDVILHFGNRPDSNCYDPVRKLHIIKFPRELKQPIVYLYHVGNRDYIRNLKAEDIQTDPFPEYFHMEDQHNIFGITPKKPNDDAEVPF